MPSRLAARMLRAEPCRCEQQQRDRRSRAALATRWSGPARRSGSTGVERANSAIQGRGRFAPTSSTALPFGRIEQAGMTEAAAQADFWPPKVIAAGDLACSAAHVIRSLPRMASTARGPSSHAPAAEGCGASEAIVIRGFEPVNACVTPTVRTRARARREPESVARAMPLHRVRSDLARGVSTTAGLVYEKSTRYELTAALGRTIARMALFAHWHGGRTDRQRWNNPSCPCSSRSTSIVALRPTSAHVRQCAGVRSRRLMRPHFMAHTVLSRWGSDGRARSSERRAEIRRSWP